MVAVAKANRVSAAASLIRLSPFSTVIMRLGSPSWRPTATAVTASGGDTTAASTVAAASVKPGMIRAETPPTTKVVTSTRITPRLMIEGRRLMKLMNENSVAAEKSSGGSTTVRMISGSSSSRGRPGMNEAARPTSASRSGAWMLRRSAKMVTAMAAIITRRICETMRRPLCRCRSDIGGEVEKERSAWRRRLSDPILRVLPGACWILFPWGRTDPKGSCT